MKSKSFLRFVSVLLCFIVCMTLFTVASFSATSENSVVTTDAVRLRSTPEINDDNFITTLGVSETLTLLKDSSQGWANVKRQNGQEGFCSVDYLNVPSASSVEFAGVTNEEVNFRQGPSTDYDSLDFLNKGTEFTVLNNSNEYWVKADVKGVEGYIYRTYTDLSLTLAIAEDSEPATEPTEITEATEPTEPQTLPSVPQLPSADPVDTPNWYSNSLLQSDTPSRTPLVGSFVLSETQLKIEAGKQKNINALILGGSVNTLASFESSDTTVAKVSNNGTVLGINEGTCEITVTYRGKTKSCKVEVFGKADIPTEPEPTQPTEPTTAPLTFELSASEKTLEKGNLFMLTSPYENSLWSSSDTKVATVKDGLVSALSEGKAVITASCEGKKGTCLITVTKAQSGLTIEYDQIEITNGKTFFNSAESTSQISWTSSDSKIADVDNGFITAKSEGVAVITASSKSGTKTCLVTVKAASPVRFTYAYPNTASKGEEITLVAITDKTRSDVQFKIDVNGTTQTVNATSKKTDGNTIIWSGTVALSQSGTFNATAYSKLGSKYTTCDDGKTTLFVRETKDLLKETQEDRRASDELISLLSEFEGYVGNVYFDSLADGLPTLGYGKVVYTGDSFYNDMTKTEAYAQLYDTVNNGGYSSNVNSYLKSLNANYNQQQFDALVSFAYNIGYYGLRSDSEIRALILEAKEKKTPETANKNAAYINGTQVNFRKGAGTEFESLGWLNYPDTLTLVDTKLVNSVWYHVKTADGTEGYVYKDYVTLGVPTVEGEIYLSLIDKAEFTRVILEYHHAGSGCIYGLLYRRVDELDLFYYGDSVRDGDENRYSYSFTCKNDKNFKL
ncbi:MAG: SH3 domain-containing protein [Clostridia bacterium]|nr:SH3 domain-containing protein [Clostridia bacterium]